MMTREEAFDAEQIVLEATGRDSVDQSLAWIAGGHRLRESDGHLLLRAVLKLGRSDDQAVAAVRRLSRQLTESRLDTAAVLFDLASATRPEDLRRAIDVLVSQCSGGTLAAITAQAVRDAQAIDSTVIPALCAVAGLSYNELQEHADARIPDEARDTWTGPQVRAVFEVVNAVVQGHQTASLPGVTAARPIELMPEMVNAPTSGWETEEIQKSQQDEKSEERESDGE